MTKNELLNNVEIVIAKTDISMCWCCNSKNYESSQMSPECIVYYTVLL